MPPRSPLLLLVLLSLAQSLAANPLTDRREIVGPMMIIRPAAWSREHASDGTIIFLPPADDDTPSALRIWNSEVQLWSTNIRGIGPIPDHQAIWGNIIARTTLQNEQASGRLAGFEWSETVTTNPSNNSRSWYRLYTIKVGNDGAAVLVITDSAPSFRELVPQVDEFLSKAQLKGQPSFTAIPKLNGVPIVAAHIHTENRANSLTSNVTNHILLFENGVAVRDNISNGPRECYAALPVTKLVTLPSSYGRWHAGGTRAIDIEWQQGPAWHLDRSGERLSLEGKALLEYRPIDDAEFNGNYVYSPIGGPSIELRMTPHGRFLARNLTNDLVCKSGPTVVTDGGGNYEVNKWTLLLHFDNGVTNLLPLTIADEEQDLQNIGKFTLASYEFVRMPEETRIRRATKPRSSHAPEASAN